MKRWDVLLERKTKKRLNADVTRQKLQRIADVAGRNRAFGFIGKIGKLQEPVLAAESGDEEVWNYKVKLALTKPNIKDVGLADRQYERVLESVRKYAEGQGWVVHPIGEVGEDEELTTPQTPKEPRTPFVVPTLTRQVMTEYFSGIYEREAHIRVIHDATKAYSESIAAYGKDPKAEVSRSHVLLKGRPGTCKTKLFERFKLWYEAGGRTERVQFVDGPTMTKAGLENYLLSLVDAEDLPEILVIEEIEKQDPDNLLTLISIMGSGYLAKLNARIGRRRELANMLIWAICNDEDVIRNFRGGVLWSRFAHRLHCPKPSPDLMRRIVEDRINGMGGKPAWAEKVMEYAYETHPKICGGRPLDDPREVLALLDGRDRLLDGSYQRDIIKILKAELDEPDS